MGIRGLLSVHCIARGGCRDGVPGRNEAAQMTYRSSIAAYDLFRAGRYTADIAYLLNITEAEALKQISQSSSAKLGLSDPYERQSVPVGERASAKVPFAGRVPAVSRAGL